MTSSSADFWLSGGRAEMSINTTKIMEMVWSTLKDAGGVPDRIVVNRLAMTIAMDHIKCPFERARILFNAGHRGPWHRGFWRDK